MDNATPHTSPQSEAIFSHKNFPVHAKPFLLAPPRPGQERMSDRALPDHVDDHVIHNVVTAGLYEQVRRIARSTVPVLILGETGTGKEHVARALHERGCRADGPFVTVNCAAIPPSLLEATLFGLDRGVSTGAVDPSVGVFERANAGTLFLDEIGELSSTAQAALLRAVETQHFARIGSFAEFPVDVRTVAATHRSLEAMVGDGSFRADLYFRLNGVQLVLPPLRDRTDEIEPLVRTFLERARGEWNVRARHVTAEALRVLSAYPWPGNVRQLRHAVEHAALLCSGEVINVADLPPFVLSRVLNATASPAFVEARADLALRESMAKFETALIDEALRRVGGNRQAASKLLRIPPRTLFRKLRNAAILGTRESPEQ